jgi:hypothetical protein
MHNFDHADVYICMYVHIYACTYLCMYICMYAICKTVCQQFACAIFINPWWDGTNGTNMDLPCAFMSPVGLKMCLALLTNSRSSDNSSNRGISSRSSPSSGNSSGDSSAAFEVAAAVAGVGRFTAGVVLEVVDGKATSAFPDIIIHTLSGSIRKATSVSPSTLARYVIGRVFWMARTRGRSQFVWR